MHPALPRTANGSGSTCVANVARTAVFICSAVLATALHTGAAFRIARVADVLTAAFLGTRTVVPVVYAVAALVVAHVADEITATVSACVAAVIIRHTG